VGAPGGGLKQCAQGWGQDRTSVGSPHMPKARSPSSQHDSGSMAGGSFFKIQRLCQRATQARRAWWGPRPMRRCGRPRPAGRGRLAASALP
jgi:hypothetical protein